MMSASVLGAAKRYLEEFEAYDSVKKIIVVSFPENIEQWKDEFVKKRYRDTS